MTDATKDTTEEESKTTMPITVIEDNLILISQLTDNLDREVPIMVQDAWMTVLESLWPIVSRT